MSSLALCLLIPFGITITLILGALLSMLARMLPLIAKRLRSLAAPITLPPYEDRIAQALNRYDAEQRAEEERIQSLPQKQVPVIALNQTRESRLGIGADGELIELETEQGTLNDHRHE